MKKCLSVTFYAIICITISIRAQQGPTLTSPGGAIPSGQTSNQFWSRAGNTPNNGSNNIFGTQWNSEIYTITNGNYRMRLNGQTDTYTVNGSNAVARPGYLLIGRPLGGMFTQRGAFSQFHVTGLNPTQFGYRPWMETGTTYTANSDLSYFGIRSLDGINDLTEHIICWSNDVSPIPPIGSPTPQGPDDMVFRFTNEINASGSTFQNQSYDVSNLRIANDIDGRHVARFTATGEFGLGNTFGVNTAASGNLYVRPKSLAHLSTNILDTVWMQFTNRNIAVNDSIGTDEKDADGFRIGIIGADPSNSQTWTGNGTAAIYNQEKRPILFSTNHPTATINTTNGDTKERVRIMSAGTPTNVSGNYPAVYNPANVNLDFTRMSISHDPSKPITAPLSLLHIGYGLLNSATAPNPPLTYGWRPWMDVGMFVASNQSDYVYLGMKNELSTTLSNRQDAVLSWGDDPSGNNGPDNLRFIFTSNSNSSQIPANSINGLEVSRMVPNLASTLAAPNYGMMGIGDFSPSGPNSAVSNQVNAKLDIDGDIRIRTVTQDNSLTQVLVIDPNDKNRVHYRSIPSSTGNGQGFFACSNTTNAPNLATDNKINLNNNNIYFEKNDILGKNHVGIGYNCSNLLRAKLSTYQTHPASVNASTIAISGYNDDVSNIDAITFTGVEGAAFGLQTMHKIINRGGYFTSYNSEDTRGIVVEIPASNTNTISSVGGEFSTLANAKYNFGITSNCYGAGSNISNNVGIRADGSFSKGNNVGGEFYANSSTYNNASSFGINSSAVGSQSKNIAGLFVVMGGPNGLPNNPSPNPSLNCSVFGVVKDQYPFSFASNVNIGIYGNAQPSYYGKVGYAGFFDGDVWINGPATSTGFAVTTSDQNFKTDVNPIVNANAILNQLHPKTFYFDTLNPYGFNFSNKKQYGLLAQQVEQILPELISNEHKPATVDTLGNIVTQGVDYKALNYDAFISILIRGHQEQQTIIDSLHNNVQNRDSIINDLNNRLSHLESCLSGILPFLCQITHSDIQPTQQEFQQQLKAAIDVQLSDKNNIILNQNVPNPFAEQTQISYSIPENVKKAQIHFYDANGKLINSVEITDRGLGQLNVYANDLSTGIYTYSLVVDGQIVASKRMIKQ